MIVKNILNKPIVALGDQFTNHCHHHYPVQHEHLYFFLAPSETLYKTICCLGKMLKKKEKRNILQVGQQTTPQIALFGDQKIDQTRPLLCLGGIYKGNKMQQNAIASSNRYPCGWVSGWFIVSDSPSI